MHTERPVRRLTERPKLGRVAHVIRVGAHDKFTVVVCSIAPEWFVGHWNGRKTVRCLENREQCEGCRNQWPERAKGYVTVCSERDYKPMLLELTPAAGEDLELAFPHSQSMRGHKILVFRERPALNAPLHVERVGECLNYERIPEDINPESTINRLWPDKPV